MTITFRVGQGFDVHALVLGRRLVIGGVEIPFELGLLGHSDADVLLHAITDAILGAAGLGDIGSEFPDSDERHRDADSRTLKRVAGCACRRVAHREHRLDGDRRTAEDRTACRGNARDVAACSGVERMAVSIKGKTAEKLGAIGRGDGIAAQAVVLLSRTA